MTHDSLLRLYCNVCHRRIWCTIQTFYKCSVCDLFTHLKCKESISKMCQTYKTPQTVFIMTIRPEIGLSSQQHRCADCRRFIGLANKKSKQVLPEARICDYQGRYHCSNCHKNEQTVIPARVIRNWDFSTRTVCQRCSNMLELLSNHPVIPLESINANLFSHIDDLVTVKNLRMTLSNLRLYVHSCKSAQQHNSFAKLKIKLHLMDNVDMYSMQDLIKINDGTLIEELRSISQDLIKHVKENCELCAAKGFYCEICKSSELLFPFDLNAEVCEKCSSVYHK
ncbi:uncharacterized protein TRIADDRAFT_23786 [Trichoplax adhaerens]|uniref:Phorbol-ester/DAG-type domain-containing protein n=1 Tax=Trichoplax adhaerens TaxID=10228 RepID=B3RVJ0_TRIAD|nr:hypothetical protein TRIADDRAFT_23786 [Trichoplax adhaerens]EDV26004.1 hypothetical protein TRIADDRAFT_23786 [Trichoplax adhaerens]|eukprot:XP_002112037.1 hypothetical protein TRIADDRAFT_23786 [Trichoplax adhaerens]